jgi:hypothetical protein
LKQSILRRIARSGTIGYLSGFETAGLASAATLAGVLWLGVSVPTLSPLHGSRAAADRSVSIALESALLGIDDGSSRSLRAATLADRLGVVPSGRLLPTPEQLRVAGTELAARTESKHAVPARVGTVTVALREPLIAAGSRVEPTGGGHVEQTLSLPTPPAPMPEPSPAPATAPTPPVRVQTEASPAPKSAAAGGPPPSADKTGRSGGSAASGTEPSGVEGPVATGPAFLPDGAVDVVCEIAPEAPAADPLTAEPVAVEPAADEPAAAEPAAGGLAPAADGEPTGGGQESGNGATGNAGNPDTAGRGNGAVNGSDATDGNAAGHGNGDGNAFGNGNGNAVGQGNPGGAGNGNANGHAK